MADASDADAYDSEKARNISPERASNSSQESSDSSFDLSDEDNSHSPLNRKKSNTAGFKSEKTREDVAEDEGNCWYSRSCFSYFTFSPELMKSKPKGSANIKGTCKKCFMACSGQVQSTTNWLRHIKVMKYF